MTQTTRQARHKLRWDYGFSTPVHQVQNKGKKELDKQNISRKSRAACRGEINSRYTHLQVAGGAPSLAAAAAEPDYP